MARPFARNRLSCKCNTQIALSTQASAYATQESAGSSGTAQATAGLEIRGFTANLRVVNFGEVRLSVMLHQLRRIVLGVVLRLVAERPCGVEREPTPTVVRYSPNNAEPGWGAERHASKRRPASSGEVASREVVEVGR